LRLEIAGEIDKKKSEFYFLWRRKKILTEKRNGLRRKTKNSLQTDKVDRNGRARTFSPFGAAESAPSFRK
jgi:hypothetical protein